MQDLDSQVEDAWAAPVQVTHEATGAYPGLAGFQFFSNPGKSPSTRVRPPVLLPLLPMALAVVIDGIGDGLFEGLGINRLGDVSEDVADADRFDDLVDFVRSGDKQA